MGLSRDGDRAAAAANRVRPLLAPLLAAQGVGLGAPVFLRIYKEPALLAVFVAGADGAFRLLKQYSICTYSGGLGPKLQEGDRQSPEGFYRVTEERLNPQSRYHLAFNLGFPNAYDRAQGRTGSSLMVHGDCTSVGCYAMTDAGIEEIYTLVAAALAAGQPYVPVHIFPFPMGEAALAARAGARWADFWANLKDGHDYFAQHGRPAEVVVRDGRYVFNEPGV